MIIFHKIISFCNKNRQSKQLLLRFNFSFIQYAVVLLSIGFFFLMFASKISAAAFQANYLSTDANGVKSYDMISDYNGDGHHVLRVLEPSSPAPGVAHNFLYVLPVEAEGGIVFGDGVSTLRALSAQNQYNVTIIAPSFKIQPWYADHATDPNYRYESFMASELQPWVKANLATSGNEQHWLLGFSKSGYGPLSLIFKHPDLFTLGAFWDFPADITLYTSYGANANYGTQANFDDNYRLSSSFVENHKSAFLSDNRLWISGYGLFQTDVADFDSLLSSKGIQHTTAAGVSRAHNWGSGWVPSALAGLYTNSIVAPEITTVSSTNSSGTTTTITWLTNKASSSKVDYSTSSTSYDSSTPETDIATRVTSHSVTLSNLLPCTTYFYRVRSKNSILNETVSTGSSFLTSGCAAASSSNTQNVTTTSDNQCHDTVGLQPPWLYGAIAQNSTSILLYFTEAAKPVDKYAIEYGLTSNNYIYGADNLGIKSESRMTYLVQDLSPNTTYFFKVRGGNGCKGGDWSNEFKATTKPNTIASLNSLPISSTKLGITPTETKTNVDKTIIQENDKNSYQVKIRVLNEKNDPVEGAEVTLHSKAQVATTDKAGIATFDNVEPGKHSVIITYDNYKEVKNINLTGNVKEFNLDVAIKQKSLSLSKLVFGIIGMIIVASAFLIIKYKRKN